MGKSVRYGETVTNYNEGRQRIKKGCPLIFFFLCMNFISKLYMYVHYLTFAYSSKTIESDSSSQRPTLAPSGSSIT